MREEATEEPPMGLGDGDVREEAEAAHVPFNGRAVHWAIGAPVPNRMAGAVLVALATRCDRYGCTIVGQRSLAEALRASDRTVRKHLKLLETFGLIRRAARATRHGGRTSDLTQLVAWPGRQLLPDAGHPRFGTRLRETLLSRVAHVQAQAALARRNAVPPPPEAGSRKEPFNEDPPIYSPQDDAALQLALNALGACATVENRAYLTADRAALQHWRELGLDVERDLVPILNEFASRGPSDKLLRTWRYFNYGVGPILDRLFRERSSRPTPPRAERVPTAGSHPPPAQAAPFEKEKGMYRSGVVAPRAYQPCRDDE